MITEQDLLAAIAECNGRRNPDAATCIKLAAYYTILDHMREKSESKPVVVAGRTKAQRTATDTDTGSEFSAALSRADSGHVIEVMDELMQTLQVMHPRLYDSVMSKLQQ